MAYKIQRKIASAVVLGMDGCPCRGYYRGETPYVIDADTCIDCGACADVCPVGAPAQE